VQNENVDKEYKIDMLEHKIEDMKKELLQIHASKTKVLAEKNNKIMQLTE